MQAIEQPTLRKARERLTEIVPDAVETLATLLDDADSKVRLGAAKEVLDRGGLPARMEFEATLDTAGLDDAIAGLILKLERKGTMRLLPDLAPEEDVIDAEVIEEATLVVEPRSPELPLPGLGDLGHPNGTGNGNGHG